MKNIERAVSNFVFFVTCLLAILLFFEDYVSIPVWLQPFGRMHPLLLHFPVVLIVLLVLLNVFRKELDPKSFDKTHKFLLYLTAFTTTLSAVMGFFLSKEPGYDSELMVLHKWIGVAVSFFVYGLVLSLNSRRTYKILLGGSFVALVFAGHLGAGLTHGMNFLMEPIIKLTTDALEITEDTPIYTGFVEPILAEKCQSCHNPQKHKGDLDMSSFAKIQEGGENGPIWEAENADSSEIILRALLPIDVEEHMPPEGKTQLTDAEFEMIYQWIQHGADETITMNTLLETDSLFVLTSAHIAKLKASTAIPKYDFDFADKELVTSLNNPYRSVAQVTPSSPALDVNIYVQQAFQLEFLTELEKIKNQIVSLNLAYMPLTDNDLSVIGEFENLEKLNLNSTNITGESLGVLESCTKLKSLSLSSTIVNAEISDILPLLPNLKELFVWNTRVSRNHLEELKVKFPAIKFYDGYMNTDDAPLKLSAPILKNKERVFSSEERIVLEHKLNGAEIRYTLDGTEPDSLTSNLYTKPFGIDKSLIVKSKAFAKNWISSDEKNFTVYVKGKEAKKATLLTRPHGDYAAGGAEVLIDSKKGEARDRKSIYWLGYRENKFSGLVEFGDDLPTINRIDFSYALNVRRDIMPPVWVEVYGGNEPDNMKLLNKANAKMPQEEVPNIEKVLTINIPESNYKYYKIEALPLSKLPQWHRNKGKRAWVFVDEIFFF